VCLNLQPSAAFLLILEFRYQVRAGILQAANYGVPQKRRRFILLASQHGVILPSFPLPSHASPFDELRMLLLPIGLQSDRLPKRLRHLPEQMHVSVSEAIGDLPQWEWEISNDDQSTDGPTQWPWDKLSSNKELNVVLGPPRTLEYISPPLNDYQRSMRRGSSGVTLHFTPEFSELQVRRSVRYHSEVYPADYCTMLQSACREDGSKCGL
jgi:site-specific DNA-cytosine methylase